jgi:hypothetical protein
MRKLNQVKCSKQRRNKEKKYNQWLGVNLYYHKTIEYNNHNQEKTILEMKARLATFNLYIGNVKYL